MPIWKEIKDFKGYEVSNEGIVRSIDRVEQIAEGVYRNRKGRELKLFKTDRGYLQVQLYINGKKYLRRVNRLVAEAFIPNPKNKKEVNHKDGDKENNHKTNLEWSTSKENSIHAIRNGLYDPNLQTTNRKVYQFSLDGELINSYESLNGAGRNMGATNGSNIRLVCLGKRNKAYGFLWRFTQTL